MSRLLAALLCLPLLLGLLPARAAEEPLFSADGYRLTRYRSPTPASVAGAQTIDTATLQRLLAEPQPPLLIDVYRQPGRTRRGPRRQLRPPHRGGGMNRRHPSHSRSVENRCASFPPYAQPRAAHPVGWITAAGLIHHRPRPSAENRYAGVPPCAIATRALP